MRSRQHGGKDHAAAAGRLGAIALGGFQEGAKVLGELDEGRVQFAVVDLDSGAVRHLDSAQPIASFLVALAHHHAQGKPAAVLAPCGGLLAGALDQPQAFPQLVVIEALSREAGQILARLDGRAKVARHAVEDFRFGESAQGRQFLCTDRDLADAVDSPQRVIDVLGIHRDKIHFAVTDSMYEIERDKQMTKMIFCLASVLWVSPAVAQTYYCGANFCRVGGAEIYYPPYKEDTDLGRAMNICAKHTKVQNFSYSEGGSPPADYYDDWKACYKVRAKWNESAEAQERRERAVQERRDKEFVESVATQP